MKYPEHRRRVLPGALSFNDQQCLEAVDFQTLFREQPRTVRALDGCKSDLALAIVAQDKLHPAVAQQAFSVEHDDHGGVSGLRTRWPL